MSATLEEQVDRYGQPPYFAPFSPQSELMLRNVDGDGKAFSNLAGLSVGYKTTKEICIGIRSQHNGTIPLGSGSWDDPFHIGPTQPFDTLMAGYTDVKRILRARDGVYGSDGFNGVTGFYFRPGDQVFGEGKGVTIFKLNPAAGALISAFHALFTGLYTLDGDHMWMEGFTVDCNWQNLLGAPAACAVNGLALYGENNVIRNVHITNGYGHWSTLHEHFGISSQAAPGGLGRNNVIEYCSADSFRGDYGGAINRTGEAGGVCVGGVTSGCLVEDYLPPTYNNSHVVAYGISGGTLRDSTARNCQHGVYIEKGQDLKLRDLTLLRCWENGIHLNPAADIVSPSIGGCTIELRDDNPANRFGVSFGQGGPGNSVSRADVSHNTIRILVTGNTPGDPSGFFGVATGLASDTDGMISFLELGNSVLDNKIDSSLHNQGPSDTYIRGNRSLLGGALASLPDAGKERFSAHAAAVQSIPNAAYTKLLLATEEYDSPPAFASSRFTATRDGIYTFRAAIYLQQDNTGSAQLIIYKNGALDRVVIELTNYTGLQVESSEVSIPLVATDYIELFAYQTSGGALNYNLTIPGSFQGAEQ